MIFLWDRRYKKHWWHLKTSFWRHIPGALGLHSFHSVCTSTSAHCHRIHLWGFFRDLRVRPWGYHGIPQIMTIDHWHIFSMFFNEGNGGNMGTCGEMRFSTASVANKPRKAIELPTALRTDLGWDIFSTACCTRPLSHWLLRCVLRTTKGHFLRKRYQALETTRMAICCRKRGNSRHRDRIHDSLCVHIYIYTIIHLYNLHNPLEQVNAGAQDVPSHDFSQAHTEAAPHKAHHSEWMTRCSSGRHCPLGHRIHPAPQRRSVYLTSWTVGLVPCCKTHPKLRESSHLRRCYHTT